MSSEFERGARAAREVCLRRSMRYDHQDRQENALSGEAYECAEDIAVLLPAKTAQPSEVPVPARTSSVEDAFREGFGKGIMAGVCVCADHDSITRDEAWDRSAAKALIPTETIPDGAEWRLTPLGEKALSIASGASGCTEEQKNQIAWDIYREFRGLYPAPAPVAEPPADAEVAQASALGMAFDEFQAEVAKSGALIRLEATHQAERAVIEAAMEQYSRYHKVVNGALLQACHGLAAARQRSAAAKEPS